MHFFVSGTRREDIDWEEYVQKVITDSRAMYKNEFTEEDRREIFDDSFLQPCQIEVLDSGHEAIWLVVHDHALADMQFYIKKGVKDYGGSEFAKRYHFESLPKDFLESRPSRTPFLWIFTKNRAFTTYCIDPREVILDIFEHLATAVGLKSRKRQIAFIQRSTSGLRSHISKLPQKDVREAIEEITKKIDTALEEIKRIDEHERKLSSVEKDIVGMRHLMGESKEFQDWRVLTSDVQRLKDEHVPRREFDTNMDRLDERIDSLNTRIEEMREIRFWSKRTIVDIVLAIISVVATLIAALLATGLLRW